MTKYADDFTCSTPVGPSVNDNASEENIRVLSEEPLSKLNLSKAKELIIKRRTALSPPDPIVNVNRVRMYLKLKLSGVTFQESTTSWDEHFGDLSSKTYAHP